MKSLAIIFFTFILIGCSGGGGGSDTPADTPLPAETISIALLKAPATNTQIPLLVILVDFDDIKFASSEAVWSQKIFGFNPGELNDYFDEISQGSFSFTPATETYGTNNDGIIKVSIAGNHPNLGSSSFKNLATTAIGMADGMIDFAPYDINTNNKIDKEELQIMFLVAGGESASGPPNLVDPSIWAHMSCFTNLDGIPILDTKEVMQCDNGSYTAFGERHFDINGPDAGIGIIAHELGHGAFYLPDLYDTNGGSEGIGNFGLMGVGSWGSKTGENAGVTPVHMSPWSKLEAGFLTQNSASISSNNIAINETGQTSYQALRINTQDVNEYFLIENRSKNGYDAGMFRLDFAVFNGGLAIWHIDESQRSGNNTDNADEERKLVDLVEADSFHLDSTGNQGDRTNLFYAGNPAINYTGELTPVSTPANSNLNSTGASTNISISNISATGSIMYIDLQL